MYACISLFNSVVKISCKNLHALLKYRKKTSHGVTFYTHSVIQPCRAAPCQKDITLRLKGLVRSGTTNSPRYFADPSLKLYGGEKCEIWPWFLPLFWNWATYTWNMKHTFKRRWFADLCLLQIWYSSGHKTLRTIREFGPIKNGRSYGVLF